MGGLSQALKEGASIGATTVQLFTSNQRRWKGRVLSDEEIAHFHQIREITGLSQIMSHASYLVNLGSADPELLYKSRKAFQEEVDRCLALGISFLNFHPGAAVGGTKEACLERVVESLCALKDKFMDGTGLRLLIETTAGQGSNIGATFEEIGYLVQNVHKKVPIGVCIDTCHIFSA